VDKLPFVSCICLTYNRAPDHLHLVGEAVESYLRQTYPADRSQLLILNDTPGQELKVEGYGPYYPLSSGGASGAERSDPYPGDQTPGIHVLNLPWRFRTLGEKYLAAMGLAQGDILMWWDDDDISLPWRIERSVARLSTPTKSDYYNPGGYWYLDASGLHHDHFMGPGFNCSAFTREGYEKGVEAEFGMHLDLILTYSFARNKIIRTSVPDSGPKEWSYIYRWGSNPEHVSGWGIKPTREGDPQGRLGYSERGKRPIVRSSFTVVPAWIQDYERMVEGRLIELVEKRAGGQKV
jgi:glycosyltransferase involved in cell wall biosynthesis